MVGDQTDEKVSNYMTDQQWGFLQKLRRIYKEYTEKLIEQSFQKSSDIILDDAV